MLKDLLDALKETIELAQDLACDLPLVYSYIGQLLALPLVRRIVHFKDLLEISKPQIELNNGERILKNVFKSIEQHHSQAILIQLYNEANINFQQFLENESASLNDFVKENVSFFFFFNNDDLLIFFSIRNLITSFKRKQQMKWRKQVLVKL